MAELLRWTVEKFGQVGIENPRVDAEHLLAHALSCSRMDLYVQHDRPLADAERAGFRDMVARRLRREPVAYILGKRGFHALDLDLAVDPAVLIPRPETEHLVDWLLEDLRPPPAPAMTVLDVGTGSGAIALAVKRARTDLTVVGVDLSAAAVEVARDNASRAQLDVVFEVADLREGLGAILAGMPPLMAVAANLPYIPTAAIDGLAPEVSHHEPRLALDGGPDGLDLVRALIGVFASGELGRAAAIYLEVGDGQAPAVEALLAAAGCGAVSTRRDYAGIGRVVCARAPVS